MWKQSVLRSAAVALSMMAAFAYAADKTEKSDKGEQAQLSKDDRNFIMEAAQGGMMEVQMGKLAQEKGQSDGVKQFGKRLEADHSKANDELKGIAQKLGVTLPAALDKKHQGKVDKMSKAKPQDFDRQFSREMVDDHEKDVKAFRKQADKGRNAELKQFASQTMPTLEEHLKMARDLAGSTNGGKGSDKGAGKGGDKGGK
jgi:putative membrane protein